MFIIGITVSSILILAGVVYYGVGWIKIMFVGYASYVLAAMLLCVYLALIAYSAKYPPLEIDNPNAKVLKLPETAATVKTGLHYILPIVVLVWCLMIERLSPGLSAFWATMLMVFIIITQKPLQAFFRENDFKLR